MTRAWKEHRNAYSKTELLAPFMITVMPQVEKVKSWKSFSKEFSNCIIKHFKTVKMITMSSE